MPSRPWRTMMRFSSISGNDVRDRGHRHQAQGLNQEVAKMGRGLLAVAKALADLPGELERHSCAAEVAAGVGAAGQARMNQHVGRREIGPDRVVVGHDQLHAQLTRQRGLGHRRDAAIHRDHQRGLVSLGQPAQGLGVDPVAFLDPVRNVIVHVTGAGQFQTGPEHARAADAVDVIIAVDDDRPVRVDRPDDSLGRLAHSRQRLGVVQAAELRLEERLGLLGLLDPPVDQQLGDQRRDPGAPGERHDPARIKRLDDPPWRHSRRSSSDLPMGFTDRGHRSLPASRRRRHHASFRDIPMIMQSRCQNKGPSRILFGPSSVQG